MPNDVRTRPDHPASMDERLRRRDVSSHDGYGGIRKAPRDGHVELNKDIYSYHRKSGNQAPEGGYK
jgi:hypothetical protein